MRNKLMPFQGPRLVLLIVIMFCTFGVLVMRLYEFQFVQYDEFKAAADANAIQNIELSAPRGVIYDRYGVKLALNAAAFNVAIVPAELPGKVDAPDSLQVLHRLSALIDVPDIPEAARASGKNVRSLLEQVVEGNNIAPYRPVIVATDVDQKIAQTIQEDNRNLPGVKVTFASVRQYPTGSTTAQIVGYLGPIDQKTADNLRDQGLDPRFERTGYAGVERYLNKDLAGEYGTKTQVVDVAGLPVRVINEVAPKPGANVRLTLDYVLQQAAQQALTDQIQAINVESGTLTSDSGVVVALNPSTGEVLAMVSWPTYDNTKFARSIDAEYYGRIAKEAQTPLLNHAISSLYPPGSTWKLLTSNAVMQEKVIDPNTTLRDNGILTVENKLAKNDVGSKQDFVCWYRKGHGDVNLIHAIAWSCDVYFYQVGGGNPQVDPSKLKTGGLGIDNLVRYATAFGIGSDLGIELPAEVGGRMPDPTWKRRNYGETWSTGDTYNAAFGQGYVTVTPLQLANLGATIANGGTMYQPTIINSWVDSEGNTIPDKTFKPRILRTMSLPTDGSSVYLNMREDMYIMGKHSLVCVCEADSPYRDPNDKKNYDASLPKCDQPFMDNYQGHLTLKDANGNPLRQLDYKVNIPYDYIFGGTCDPDRIIENINYQPPFLDPGDFKIVQEGMRDAVNDPAEAGLACKDRRGTSCAAIIDYFPVGGKTGTAEYCDEVARPLGLCVHGSWPSHAWFFGYGPLNAKPEIAVVAFVYHGNEGSANALPVARKVLACYARLKEARLDNKNPDISTCAGVLAGDK